MRNSCYAYEAAFSGQVGFSVIQSNSALHYECYMGTISIPLVLEQQNPKVYRKSMWSLAMSKDFMQGCQ